MNVQKSKYHQSRLIMTVFITTDIGEVQVGQMAVGITNRTPFQILVTPVICGLLMNEMAATSNMIETLTRVQNLFLRNGNVFGKLITLWQHAYVAPATEVLRHGASILGYQFWFMAIPAIPSRPAVGKMED